MTVTVVDRLGIGYEALREINPRIIYCSISAFGQNGPYRDRPGYDTIGQALSGYGPEEISDLREKGVI